MKSETSSQASGWHPGGDPRLTAVPLPSPRQLSRREYLNLLQGRLGRLLRHLKEDEARALLAEWKDQELLQLRELAVQEWPEFLLAEVPSVNGKVWSQAGLGKWPRQASPSPEASKALNSVGFREWLSLAFPNPRQDE